MLARTRASTPKNPDRVAINCSQRSESRTMLGYARKLNAICGLRSAATFVTADRTPASDNPDRRTTVRSLPASRSRAEPGQQRIAKKHSGIRSGVSTSPCQEIHEGSQHAGVVANEGHGIVFFGRGQLAKRHDRRCHGVRLERPTCGLQVVHEKSAGQFGVRARFGHRGEMSKRLDETRVGHETRGAPAPEA